jgi:hypothetical protein
MSASERIVGLYQDNAAAWDALRGSELFERLPGGVLMFTSGTEEGCAMGEWQGEPLYHGSLSTAEYARLLEQHGFDVVHHVPSDPQCGDATIWLARLRP